MKRVNAIWQHKVYQDCLERVRAWEEDREFCRHTPEHFLDVARLTWILALEAGIPAEKELVYAAGLLHDIGRFRQYEEGIPHEEASAQIAEGIGERARKQASPGSFIRRISCPEAAIPARQESSATGRRKKRIWKFAYKEMSPVFEPDEEQP